MKSVKTLGLVLAAVIAAMTAMTASSAMAEHTELCSVNEPLCAAGNVISHVHLVDPLEIFVSPVITTHCQSLFLGSSLGLANPLVLHGNFSFSNCTNGCIVQETSSSALITILKEGAGSLTITNFTVQLHCGEILNCTYSGSGLKGTVVNASLPSTAGKLVSTKQPLLKTGGLFCPKESTFTTSLESLTDLYLSK